MTSKLRIGAALAVALVWMAMTTSTAKAVPLVLDSFALSQALVSDGTVGGAEQSSTVGPDASILGGNATRKIIADLTAGAGSVSIQVAGAVVIGGNAGTAGPPPTQGTVSLVYTLIAGTLDLSKFLSLDMVLSLFDNGAAGSYTGADLDVKATIGSAGGSSTNSLSIPKATPTPYLISFKLANFVGTATQSAITNIRFDFTLKLNQDINLSGDGGIIINDVPEPASLTLLGIAGVVGAFGARRRLFAKAA